MSWKEYFFALFLTNTVVLIFIFIISTLQNYLPLSDGKGGLSIDLAFNTAISFITDTNLQYLVGNQQLSNFSQMVTLTLGMFVAPASGIATAFAIIRPLIRKNFGLGNFYVDLTRIIMTLLLPVAIVSSLVLMTIGVPQTLNSHIETNVLENIIAKNNTAAVTQDTISIGPVASFESIKLLGSNGGGFFGSNSGHPLSLFLPFLLVH
jgi:K+-transporting ATPase ATPase A chain